MWGIWFNDLFSIRQRYDISLGFVFLLCGRRKVSSIRLLLMFGGDVYKTDK